MFPQKISTAIIPERARAEGTFRISDKNSFCVSRKWMDMGYFKTKSMAKFSSNSISLYEHILKIWENDGTWW